MAIPPTCLHAFVHSDPEVMYQRLLSAGLWSGAHTKEELHRFVTEHRRAAEAAAEAERRNPAPPGYLGPTPIDLSGLELSRFVNEVGRELASTLVNQQASLSAAAREALASLSRENLRESRWIRRLWRSIRRALGGP